MSSLAPRRPPARRGRFDYVTVGHVTVDVIAADGSRRPGGGAFYSALQAARLGLRALILTQGSAPELEALLEPYRPELAIRILPAAATTTLRTSWSGTHRTQRLLAWAGPIAEAVTAVDTQILHFAPVARETPAVWSGHADFVGLTPQGLVRKWDRRDETDERMDRETGGGTQGETGGDMGGGMAGETSGKTGGNTGNEAGAEIFPAPLPDDRRSLEALLPRDCSAVVISEQERAACAPLLDAAMAQGATVAITAGPGATTVETPDGKSAQVQAPPVTAPREDLGAGDVFAAAFFVALYEGLSPAQAAAFGNAAAAIRVAGSGADAIGDRHAIEARVQADHRIEQPRPSPS
jgi:pfkB family carbohydrate kinase